MNNILNLLVTTLVVEPAGTVGYAECSGFLVTEGTLKLPTSQLATSGEEQEC